MSPKIRIRVAAVLIENGKLLLIAHKKRNVISWLLPGGGVNPGESLEDALKRELKEELNIIVDIGDVALICDSISTEWRKHILNICFFCCYISGEYALQKEKILHDFAFYSADELEDLLIFPPIKKELKDILSGSGNKVYQGKRWIKQ